ncbi:MAG: ATP-binding protein [Cyanobacteria bacterium P01_A01_bin.123]
MYYIDFSSVRGGQLTEALERTIVRLSPNEPTCQLFSGHIGCGKSTELLRLKSNLELQGFYVVYFESTDYLDMADVDITDILLAIIRRVSESLEEIGIRLSSNYFSHILNEISDLLNVPISSSSTMNISTGISEVGRRARVSPKIRSQLRQYLEPRTNSILEAINVLLRYATEKLMRQGKKGIAILIDNLDRIDSRSTIAGRSQPEYIFIDRGEQLRALDCHLVYTVPISVIFSNDGETLKNRLGGGIRPKVLPMIPVKHRDGSRHEEGMSLLRQMVLARAFPRANTAQRFNLIYEIFDSPETLDRLCFISGGHVRNLLGLLYRCLQEEDPPFSRSLLEKMIRETRDVLVLSISEREWKFLIEVVKTQIVSSDKDLWTLLRSLFLFEYRDQQGSWFDINPVLIETEKFKSFQL